MIASVAPALLAVADGAQEHAGTPGFPLLTSLVVLPAIGALLIALIPRRQETLLKLSGFGLAVAVGVLSVCLLYTSPSPRDRQKSRMPSSA